LEHVANLAKLGGFFVVVLRDVRPPDVGVHLRRIPVLSLRGLFDQVANRRWIGWVEAVSGQRYESAVVTRRESDSKVDELISLPTWAVYLRHVALAVCGGKAVAGGGELDPFGFC